MKIIYALNKAARTALIVWMGFVLVTVLASSAKRFVSLYKEEVDPDELYMEAEHGKEKSYAYYTEEAQEAGWDGAVVCIDGRRTHWSSGQTAGLSESGKVDTSIEVLTFTLPPKGILFREKSVSYLKYSCLGEGPFTEEEEAYYREAAARRFTYRRHARLDFKDAAAYQDFIPNEDIGQEIWRWKN